MKPQRTIAVVIPTYARDNSAATTAGMVKEQLETGDTVLVVWQGGYKPEIAEDNTVRLLYSSPPNLPKARNMALKYITQDIVVYLDDDISPHENLIIQHKKSYDNAGIGAVAGAVDDPIFKNDCQVPSYFDTKTGKLQQCFSLRQSCETISFMGANMSMRTDVLKAVGGFDTNFRRNALWEEIDCAFRIRESGLKILFNADARVTHHRRESGGCRTDVSWRYLYHRYANTAYFSCRHAPRNFLRAWFGAWYHEIEYYSRHRVLFFKHDPSLVLAGFGGLVGGCLRYLLSGRNGLRRE